MKEMLAREKFLQRLPLFMHLFFALTVITGFQRFAETYQWRSQPQLGYTDPSSILVPLSFVLALYWIVTDWIAYSWLIERHPYTLDFLRFIIDVLGFSLMFAVINFSFLAANGDRYHYFILTMGSWHALIAFWHVVQELKSRHEAVAGLRTIDAVFHALKFLTYLVLGLAYLYGVSGRVGEPGVESLRYVLSAITFAAIIAWNTHRIFQIRAQVLVDS